MNSFGENSEFETVENKELQLVNGGLAQCDTTGTYGGINYDGTGSGATNDTYGSGSGGSSK
ncbi:MAG: hypothetical protein LBB48_02425 [Treponema sp.]|jgi:bacteriocin-like protein|nr:hypothetical protein [Treponema sp.]